MEVPSLSCFTQEIRVFSPQAPFSDESHVQFYGCRAFRPPSKLCFQAPSRPSAPVRSKTPMVSLQAVCSSTCMTCEPATEQNLKKELADLKLQMKQKKKDLKAQMKEKKKMKAMKEEEKKKEGCSSESSSSSESSDCECETVNMKMLRQGQAAAIEISGAELQTQADLKKDGAQSQSPPRVSASGKASAESPAANVSNKIEVCVGGKCKRAGSEQLLLAFRGHIPDASSVDAVPCKCMGKCAMGINVRVHKEDTNPQHHSHVGVEDASLILSHHFSLGRPPTGLPTFGQEARTTPQRLVTALSSSVCS